MFELTVTGHILFIRWCFYLIPYYLLKSLSSCRKDAQKSHAQSSRTTHILLFPFFPKYSSKEWTLKISNTTLVQHHNLTLLVLTRVLGGERHCWFIPSWEPSYPHSWRAKWKWHWIAQLLGEKMVSIYCWWYCHVSYAALHSLNLHICQWVSVLTSQDWKWRQAWTYLKITASVTYVFNIAQLMWESCED